MRTLIAAALLTATGAAMAQSQPDVSAMSARMQAMLESRFQQADVNHDGKLTKQEAENGMPRIAQHFSEIDTTGRGYVTLDQIEAFMAKAAAAQGQ